MIRPASAEDDGFDPSAAHPCKSLVGRKTILLTFANLIRSRQAVSPISTKGGTIITWEQSPCLGSFMTSATITRGI